MTLAWKEALKVCSKHLLDKVLFVSRHMQMGTGRM